MLRLSGEALVAITLTDNDARQQLFGRIVDLNATYGPGPLKVLWEGIPDEVPASDPVVPWLRVALRFATGNQRTFGASSHRVYQRRGILGVQIFTPMGTNNPVLADTLVTLFRDGLESTQFTKGLILRNIRRVGGGPDPAGGPWTINLIQADFEFDALN